jgi:hypothetical protein
MIIGDSEFVFSPWQRRQGVATIVESALRYPFQRRRWRELRHRFTAALLERADGLQCDETQALSLASWAAFSLALPECPRQPLTFVGDELAPSSLDAWARSLRTGINRLATEDLLGIDWRPRRAQTLRREMDTAQTLRRAVNAAERRAWLEMARLLDRSDLADYHELIRAFVEADYSITTTARILGISPHAVSLRFARLRKRLA